METIRQEVFGDTAHVDMSSVQLLCIGCVGCQ